jgi:hypothetical protein
VYEGEWINGKKINNGSIKIIIKNFVELVERDLQYIDHLILEF